MISSITARQIVCLIKEIIALTTHSGSTNVPPGMEALCLQPMSTDQSLWQTARGQHCIVSAVFINLLNSLLTDVFHLLFMNFKTPSIATIHLYTTLSETNARYIILDISYFVLGNF